MAYLEPLPPMPDDNDVRIQQLMGMMRLPKEIWERSLPLMKLGMEQADEHSAALEPLYQRGQAVQQNATKLKSQYQADVKKPLPINAALMGLNSAMGGFAQALDPKGGHAQSAAMRREFEIGQLKERRMQALKMQEEEMVNEAKRAEEMGDFEARTRVATKLEKSTAMRSALGQGMQSYYEAKDKRDLEVLKHSQKVNELVLEYSMKATTGLGEKLNAKVKAQLDGLDATFKSQAESLDIQLRNTSNILDEKKQTQERQRIMREKDALARNHMMTINQLIGAIKPEEVKAPPKKDIMQGARDVITTYMQNGHTNPQEIINDIDKAMQNPEDPFWAVLGVDPMTTNPETIRGMLYPLARKLGPKVDKSRSELREVHMKLTDERFDPTHPRAKRLIERYNALQRTLRNFGLEDTTRTQPGMFIN